MSRRPFVRFSLRALFVMLTCITVVLAVLENRAHRQRSAVRVVNELRGAAAYEYQRHPATRRMPSWMDDYFCSITQVVLNDTRVTDDDLAKLTELPHLRVLLLQNTAITDAAINHFDAWKDMDWVDLKGTSVTDAAANQLRKKFPKCEIDTHWLLGCSRCRKRFPTRDLDVVRASVSLCPDCKMARQ